MEILLWGVIAFCIILFRYYILEKFGFKYTDSDQSIMWLGAKEYSQGLFHEPRFYGQNYNSMMEAFFAVPLIWLGVSVNKALPVITSVLTLLPFFIISVFTFQKKSKFAALLILSIPLLLPLEYDLITCLSRGFVTGIFVATFCCIPLFITNKKWGFFISGLALIAGYSINANSILVSLPCLFLIFLNEYRNRNLYLFTGMGFLLGLAFHLMAAWFYFKHPNYVLHNFNSEYSFEKLLYGIKNIDAYFNYVTPIFSKKGWVVFVILSLIACILFKEKRNKEGITISVIILLLILPFASSKVHDGTNSVFFPHARMYLSVPILIGLSISFLNINAKKWGYYFLLVIPAMLLYKIDSANNIISEALKKDNVVAVAEAETIIKECKRISEISKKNEVDLILINNHWFYDFYTYGCPACIEEFPKTLRPIYERRTWRLIEDKNKVYKNILIIDVNRKMNEEFNSITAIEEMQGLYILKDNHLPTMELLKKLKIDVLYSDY